jgi:hypothetical protein
MHYTKEGKYFSESECKAWFERLCECGHRYGDHYPETCHYGVFHRGKHCSCPQFKLKAVGRTHRARRRSRVTNDQAEV